MAASLVVAHPATFPVDHGTVVAVSCETGRKLIGSSSITCAGGTVYTMSDGEPACEMISRCNTTDIELFIRIVRIYSLSKH